MFLFLSRPRQTFDHIFNRVKEPAKTNFLNKLDNLHNNALRTGLVDINDLQDSFLKSGLLQQNKNRVTVWYGVFLMAIIMITMPIFIEFITFLLSVRCFFPNNYFVLEATRPISDCKLCRDVNGPLIVNNMSRKEFEPLAYTSRPIVIKNAVAHWPALELLNMTSIKNIYENIPGALDTNCQFLKFNSDFASLKELFKVFEEKKVEDLAPWYVGWSNCHPIVLKELRKLYPRPHFLPKDAEMPNSDFIFVGYNQVAFMHLDYVPRLMWQAQIKGQKNWILSPTPECDLVCKSFSFEVDAGDAVLMDTKIWHHGTSVPKGQFSITIQSEYG